MSARTIGVLCGLAAAAAFEASYLLLATQARRVTPAARPGVSFLRRLARRPWWLAGMGLSGVAFVLELVALRHVSLLVTQPLLAVGLVGLALGARIFLGERVGPRQFAAVTAIAVGVTIVVVGAPAGTTHLPWNGWSIAAAGVLAVVLVSPQLRRVGSPWWLVAAAAAGDTLVALATLWVANAWPHRLPAVLAGVAAVAICGLTAVTSEMAALQRLPVSGVAPVVSAAQVTLPVLLVALLGHGSLGSAPARGTLLALGVLVVGAGVFELSRAGDRLVGYGADAGPESA